MHLTRNRHRSPAQQWVAVAVTALLSAGLWFGWFGWDTEYQYDAAAGTDVTGLWMVGAVLVALGTTLGSAVLLGIAAAVESMGKDLLRT
ncbi:hypothetical protein [Arthrobacter sp. Br18]|uniref:hypothetical protein n=1 Tax=Arthrobacter sp. Br18 TaxID=1312954 RepID=UPI000479DB20|nr:hypothetical protein [Arthrobacter sp. Br18]